MDFGGGFWWINYQPEITLIWAKRAAKRDPWPQQTARQKENKAAIELGDACRAFAAMSIVML
jgi:hypothetical protein